MTSIAMAASMPVTPMSWDAPRRQSKQIIRRSLVGWESTRHAAGMGLSHTLTCEATEPGGAEQAMVERGERAVSTNTTGSCPDCKANRDLTKVCPRCGAPPVSEHRTVELIEGVRDTDLEPYVTLRYIA